MLPRGESLLSGSPSARILKRKICFKERVEKVLTARRTLSELGRD
jgi:hypothetical protein